MKTDTDVAARFISAVFGEGRTTGQIYFSSLANDRDDKSQPGERHVLTRSPHDLAAFATKWDRPGRGLFFCVGTVNGKRAKDNIVEIPGLWADIDFKGVDATAPEIHDAVARLQRKPTIIVESGHGLHLYWLFEKAIPAQENREQIEFLLKRLCDHVAGDPQVCEISRLMRLPGTHNTKFESEVPVTFKMNGGRHEF